MIYPDTSFLLPLYFEGDAFHLHASRIAAKFTESLPFTWLGEIELATTLHRALAGGLIDAEIHRRAFLLVEGDVRGGILAKTPMEPARFLPVALDIASKQGKTGSLRTLDLMHVAAAIVIGASTVASFDLRQRGVAKACGLELLPRNLAKK